MTRWTLLVDKAAKASCCADHPSALPLPASSTTNGLSAKSRKDAACSMEELPRAYSSIVLRRWLAVGTPTRRPRPRRAVVEANAEKRLMRSSDLPPTGGVALGFAEAGAVESISTIPTTSSGYRAAKVSV
jgi:hypothetical protein